MEESAVFTEKFIRSLKQNNVSVDAEKTKKNVVKAWKTAAKVDRNKVLALSGVALASMQRAYRTGKISAKLVVSLAQTLNLDPQYLVGGTDEPGKCSEEGLKTFLKQHKYTINPGDYAKGERKPRRKNATPEPVAEAAPATIDDVTADSPDYVRLSDLDPALQNFLDELTEEEVVLLVKAALLKAKAGGEYAEVITKLKLFLLA
jgi:hypothetical protein